VTQNSPAAAPARSPEQIKADITATQERLAATVDNLNDRLSPESLMREAGEAAKGVFVRPDGSIKGRPIAIIAGTVAGLVVLRKIFGD
jgi:hypothetical protein